MKRIRCIVLVIAGLLPNLARPQVAVELEKGDKAYDNLSFDEALFFFEVANDQQPNDPAITRRIANLYRRIGQMTISAEWYKKTLDLDSTNALDMLYYAESLKSLSQYDEAVEWYEKYAKVKPDDKRGQSHLKDRAYYKDLFADTLRYDMKRLKINNSDPVIGLTPFQENTFLLSAINAIQSSNEKGNSEYLQYLDVYQVTLSEKDELENPVRLDKNVNCKYHDGPAYYSASEQKLFITRNNMKGGKPILDKKGTVNLRIYSSEFKNGKWTPAEEVRIGDDDFSYGHPCLSKDGEYMYMVSNRDGGYGGTDLYVAQKNPSGWGQPINLGPKVNTEGNEMFPFISNEGQLFFASDGHAGLGGMDIFVSDNMNSQWQAPLNLGAPINSSSDDFAILYDKKSDKGFYCSNRSGRGNDDIFFYTHKKLEKTILAGTIRVNAMGVTLAGERIRINTVNTGMSAEQRLDDGQNFRITADPGDIIEVYMTNSEYFDVSKPVFRSTIANPIVDPYISLGEYVVELKKIPLRSGALSQFEPEVLATSVTSLQNLPLPDVKDDNKSGRKNELLESLSSKESTISKKDQSSLIVTNAETSRNAEATRLYKENIAFGEQLFRQHKYDEAKQYYTEALKQVPGDPYAKSRLKEIQNIYAESASAAGTDVKVQTEGSNKKPKIDFESTPAVINLEGLDFNNIIFDYNKSFIRDGDKSILDKVAVLLKENPETIILIKAYCDSRGSMTYNQSLSMSRAMAVQGYLVQKGITRTRIQTEWFGEQRPLNGCEDGIPCKEEEYEINRRAELKIVAKGS